jgi:hypothetical protein
MAADHADGIGARSRNTTGTRPCWRRAAVSSITCRAAGSSSRPSARDGRRTITRCSGSLRHPARDRADWFEEIVWLEEAFADHPLVWTRRRTTFAGEPLPVDSTRTRSPSRLQDAARDSGSASAGKVGGARCDGGRHAAVWWNAARLQPRAGGRASAVLAGTAASIGGPGGDPRSVQFGVPADLSRSPSRFRGFLAVGRHRDHPVWRATRWARAERVRQLLPGPRGASHVITGSRVERPYSTG